MMEFGRILIWLGAILLVAGVIVWALGRAGFRGLPGDINYESDGVRIYFPIVTCIVLSIVLSLLVWLWRWWMGK